MIVLWNQAIDSIGVLASARLLVPLLTLIVLWCWEFWRPFFDQRDKKIRHDLRNLFIGFMNASLLAFTLGLITIVIAELVDRNGWGLLAQFTLADTVRWLPALVLLDGWMYLWHRANHRVPFLWRFHRMHHSDLQMDATTAIRFHLGEVGLSAALRCIVIPVLGITVWELVCYEILMQIVVQFHHANISIGRFDRWLRLLIVTPDMHKMHHSRLQTETDSNYSSVFSFWDRLAGTWTMRPETRSIEFGLAEFSDEASQTIGGMLKTPLWPGKRSITTSHKGHSPEMIEHRNMKQ
ncbi:MAG: sterol desaturase family protein [Planctomycetota bacterium]|nr:sterol desaturase family protein [Planctomycetota bacterium]MDA1213122.1 sterol desaturase family protein [Planctomycetota bacterium]